MRHFGQNVKAARLRERLSQNQLAKLCHLPPSQISHIETGRRMPIAANIVKLAWALRTSTDKLLNTEILSTIMECPRCGGTGRVSQTDAERKIQGEKA